MSDLPERERGDGDLVFAKRLLDDAARALPETRVPLAATYLLDAQTILERGMQGAPPIGNLSRVTVHDADVAAGCHVMVVVLEYFTRYPTPYGYDYVLRVRSSRALSLGGPVKLTSIDSRGGITTPIEKRFAVLWDEGH